MLFSVEWEEQRKQQIEEATDKLAQAQSELAKTNQETSDTATVKNLKKKVLIPAKSKKVHFITFFNCLVTFI